LTRIVGGDAQVVYAAEPDPLNYRCLVETVRANGLDGFICPDRVAIAHQAGTGRLRRARRIGTHTLVREEDPPRTDHERVETMTLDDWTTRRAIDLDAVGIIKVDVQGWEARVLEGASNALARSHIRWIIEVSPRHLAAAGTPLGSLLAIVARHFTHAVDLSADARPMPVSRLSDALGYLERERTHTDLVLYR
jgi:FkbM family methyltransferase